MHPSSTSRHRESGAVHRSDRRDSYYEESESDDEPNSHSPNRHGRDTLRLEVQRSWRAFNPEVSRVLGNAALHEAIDMLEHHASRRNRSFSRPSRPTPTGRHQSPDRYHINSRPLGYSNLRALNETRNAQHPMQRRLQEDQRNGPYDAVQSVDQRYDYDYDYDYDRRGRHASSGPNTGYQKRFEDGEEEEDDDDWYGNSRSGNYRR